MKLHARESAVVFLKDGTAVNVTQGDVYDRGDPVVRQHKWLFEIIEQATAGPGEVR